MQPNAHPARLFAWRSLAAMLILAFSLPIPQPVLAQTAPPVWYVAPTGDDANSCSAPNAPCRTIDAAITKAAFGQKIAIAIGTYTSTNPQVVLVNKTITLLGGWDAGFTAQTGLSTIDGEEARRGILINDGIVVLLDRFLIQHGIHASQGGGIYSRGNLTLNNSVVTDNISYWMGGGIEIYGTAAINNSTIQNNSAGLPGHSGGGGGGGIEVYGNSELTLNNVTLSGNQILGSFYGSAVEGGGAITLNNTTVSGNTGAAALSISGSVIGMALNNSTVVNNPQGGIKNYSGIVSLQNSIVAKNGLYNCNGPVVSSGYNLLGDIAYCAFTSYTGDLVGSGNYPIDPLLGPLQDNGGPTLTHALLPGSPALNAGNPAIPGSDSRACLKTDQRGLVRPSGGICDIGAYEEGQLPVVTSIVPAGPNPTGAASVDFAVTFSTAVTGVDLTDFALTTAGVIGPSISAVSGSGAIYTVTVATGVGEGTIRLDLRDDDSIVDSSGTPLGGRGTGNGDFTTGVPYTILRTVATISPAGMIWDHTPTYKWSKLTGATKYAYQLWADTQLIYTKTVGSAVCGATQCQHTPTNFLPRRTYKWRVRAYVGGAWGAYGPFQSFELVGPDPGFWHGEAVSFYVVMSRAYVQKFTASVTIPGCGSYSITQPLSARIVRGKFTFTGAYYVKGIFDTPTSVHGTFGFSSYEIPGCGYVTSGPFTWTTAWSSPVQPIPALDAPDLIVPSPLQTEPTGSFEVKTTP